MTKQCDAKLDFVVTPKSIPCRRLPCGASVCFPAVILGARLCPALLLVARAVNMVPADVSWCCGFQIGGLQIVDASQFQPAVTSELQNSIYAEARAKSSGRPASSHGSCIGYATVRFAWAFRRSNNAGMSHGEFFCKTVNASGLNP